MEDPILKTHLPELCPECQIPMKYDKIQPLLKSNKTITSYPDGVKGRKVIEKEAIKIYDNWFCARCGTTWRFNNLTGMWGYG